MKLSEALEQIDGMIDLVQALIAENQPDSTQQAISQMRDGMQAFAGLSSRFGADEFNAANVAKMQIMSDRIMQLRGHISKVSAITAQQLAALMPQANGASTYGGSKLPGSSASVARMYHVSG